jgi:hypothetical protein
VYNGKVVDFVSAFKVLEKNLISNTSTSFIDFGDNCLDYVFIDPPFGANLQYSDLNIFWEGWLKLFTNIKQEAVVNNTQKKGVEEYSELMHSCFNKIYRALKPGHWVTIEFSNTKAAIWNRIQTSLSEAGFIVANTDALDKKQGSFNAVTSTTAVKQDLVISAYKPNGGFEERFKREAATEEGVWDFVRTHLGYLPVTKDNKAVNIPERDPRILFDKVVAYYVRKGVDIPIATSQDFQWGLRQRFDERDGMFFLAGQSLEYDKRKLESGGSGEQETALFVMDESSAIQWLKAILAKTPMTQQDLYPLFMPEISQFRKNEVKPELSELLQQNFIEDEHTHKWRVPNPEKVADLEQLREKELLRDFAKYVAGTGRLKEFRMEAVRAGFKKAWANHDYETIIKVARRIPSDVLEEDEVLLMFYTSAKTRMGGE